MSNVVKTKIYIGACGIGRGHVRRMLYFVEEVKNNMEILFSTYNDGVPPLERNGIRFIKSPPMELEFGGPGIKIEPKLFAAKFPIKVLKFLLQLRHELIHMRSFKPDIVISDSRLSTVIAAKLLGIPCILLAHQLNIIIPSKPRDALPKWKLFVKEFSEKIIGIFLSRLWQLADKILIPDVPPPYSVSYETHKLTLALTKNHKAMYIGPLLSRALRTYVDIYADNIRKKYGVPKGKILVYILVSGSEYERQLMKKAVKRLIEEIPENDEMFLIVSLSSPSKLSVRKCKNNVQVWSWIPDNLEVMAVADVIVIMAGYTTINEAIFFGKPMVVVPFPYHTEKESHARTLKKLGVAEVLQVEELTYENLKRAVISLLRRDKSALKKLKKLVREMDGVKTLVSIIGNVLNRRDDKSKIKKYTYKC
ncbi:MAG: glycosyltransferase [Candidatus Baldrarchaeia archaeon]